MIPSLRQLSKVILLAELHKKQPRTPKDLSIIYVLYQTAFLCYLSATVLGLCLYYSQLFAQNKTAKKVAHFFFVFATTVLSFGLVAHCLSVWHESLSIIDFMRGTKAITMTLGVSWTGYVFLKKYQAPVLELFLAPFATLMIFYYCFLHPDQMNYGSLHKSYLTIHIISAFMGMLITFSAGLISFLYLWQRRLLKKKELNLLSDKIPAMDILEKILVVTIITGLIYISASLVSGWFFIHENNFQLAAQDRYKIIWSLSVWLWYLITFMTRTLLNLPIRRMAQMSLIGFGLFAVAFFGMAFYHSAGGM